MKAKYRPVNRLARPIVCICLLFVFLAWPGKSVAHDEWFRDLDLEPVLSEASLVLAGGGGGVGRTGNTGGGGGGVGSLPLTIPAGAGRGGGVFLGNNAPDAAVGRGRW